MFSDIDVLQSSVATRIRFREIFYNSFIANFLQNLSVQKNFENRLKFDAVTATSLVSRFLCNTEYTYIVSSVQLVVSVCSEMLWYR